MHYAERPNSVRVDFFKETGKWYATEAVVWDDDNYHHPFQSLQDAFRTVLRKHLKGRMVGMIAVCLEPYAENSYPVMVQLEAVDLTPKVCDNG